MATPSKNEWAASPPRIENPVWAWRTCPVGFFAEVEVRRNGVLEQVDDAVAGEHEGRSPERREADAFRDHVEDGDGHHESGAKGDEVAEIVLRPAAAHQNHAADDVGDGGEGSENEREKHRGAKKWLAGESMRDEESAKEAVSRNAFSDKYDPQSRLTGL